MSDENAMNREEIYHRLQQAVAAIETVAMCLTSDLSRDKVGDMLMGTPDILRLVKEDLDRLAEEITKSNASSGDGGAAS